jgi:hypothetical protein
MGSINSEGIYEYDGTDSVTPLQTFMNLLSASVTDVVSDLRADLTPVSSNISLATSGGTSGSASIQWRRGGTAGVIFQFVIGSASNGSTIATVDAAYRPPMDLAVPLVGNSPTTPNTIWAFVRTNGVTSLQFYGGNTPSTSVILRGVGSWPAP